MAACRWGTRALRPAPHPRFPLSRLPCSCVPAAPPAHASWAGSVFHSWSLQATAHEEGANSPLTSRTVLASEGDGRLQPPRPLGMVSAPLTGVLKMTTGSLVTSTGARCGGPSVSSVGPASRIAAPIAASNCSVTNESARTPRMPKGVCAPACSLLSAADRSLCDGKCLLNTQAEHGEERCWGS
jgi:hypothetical protein